MKTVMFLSILFCAIALPVLGELTPQDLDKIRLIIHEEHKPIKAEIASLKNDVSWIRGKLEGIDKQFEGVDKQFGSVDKQFGSVDKQFESVDRQFESVGKQISHATNVTYGLMVSLIVAAVGIPQIVIAWRGRRDSEQARRIEELSQEIETLKQQRIVSP